MTRQPVRRGIRVEAFAKINLTLRVLGARPDGYHDVRTVLQSVAVHDTLTFRPVPGGFQIQCDDPKCPTDESNLVWRAAERVWRAAGRRGRPAGVHVHLTKRIPLQAGLGGGSSDAAAAIRALAALWRADLSDHEQHAIAAVLGADVPFFLHGGIALGLERGDLLFPLIDQPAAWVTLVIPPFGVSTKDAYEWIDRDPGRQRDGDSRKDMSRRSTAAAPVLTFPRGEMVNDLQQPVSARHPAIARVASSLRRDGAYYSAMSGSGSAVFGLFKSREEADAAARGVSRHGRVLVTRTLNRAQYAARSLLEMEIPSRETRLAGKTAHRIHSPIAPRRPGHA
jgi:4-diphosphocytidyl-2-C-methyl-D-erythritol kinase